MTENLIVSTQYDGAGNDYNCQDQPKGLREERWGIIVAREGILPALKMRSRTYLKKLNPYLRVVATRDINVSQDAVSSAV
ncbi:MAG: hypothetical protein F6K08_30770 [Okeania sp. SIO1H6]|nr:hypothetical protein [Okeania sp. SIO1H6]